MDLTIETAPIFRPLLEPARYKGAHGGRGSGKSHFFGELLVEECLRQPGTLAVCIRETQKTLAQSSKRLVEAKIETLGVGRLFKVFTDKIETPGGGLIIFQGMQDHTAESIKSLEGYRIAWVEEAQTLSARSLALLRPTIRVPNSEIWANWNPRRKSDAIDEFLRANKPENAIVVEANWRDNPWFPAVLEEERRLDEQRYPERYRHIWEGDYAGAFEGAYFAKGLNQARSEGRIGKVAADPLLPIRAFWDIGGAGANADATAIWIAQFVGQEIRVLDYCEGIGQPLSYYVDWLRGKGYQKAICILPHDGVATNNITGKKYEDHLRDAEFDVPPPIPNQGKGAAAMRIEAVRRLLPKCWFNEKPTEPGREALGYYHEKRDETRNVGLGPDHDWSSHCFVGATEVLTRYGMCQINMLPNQGDILTPCGWKQYRNPRRTRVNAPLVEVTFDDGLTVRCTPDHLFLTANGWKSAERLMRGTLIRSGLTRSRSISMAASIAAGLVTTIGRAVGASFIETFGRLHSVLYRPDVTSTIAMATPTTTGWPISNAYRQASIYRPHGMPAIRQSLGISTSLRQQDARLLNGTLPKKEDYGTDGTLSEARAGRNGSASRETALSAAPLSTPSFARAATPKSIAARLARSLRIASASSTMFGPRTIASVRRLSETADVWCLTVPNAECFSLANGAVVHNCADAFGLMCVCYEEPSRTRAFSRKIEYPNYGYA